MSLLSVVLISAAVLSVAYVTYGRVLARLLRLDPDRETPAVTLRDDVDYVPIEPKFLLSQHFSAIAAAGPIVGPILAGALFGWLPALIWILVGSIFIGGVHDITSLTASIRHRARCIAEVVREHMSRRSYVMFLTFVWFALMYIIAAFTDITASSFLGRVELESGQVISGGGIATSSLLYLALPIAMGLLLRFTKVSLRLATVFFLPLVALAIWGGQHIPLDLSGLLGLSRPAAQRVWNVALLAYCFAASLMPMWLLLQPRGHLGGYFLYFALFGGALGLVIANEPIQYPAFRGWVVGDAPLLPTLCILIACGACSGFHSIVASGTTSKQLRRETDAKPIGYGAMLLEAMVAVISLCCVMRLSQNHALLAGGPKPNFLYAHGVGSFLAVLGVPITFAISFGLMAFTTFVYDTLDVCTRLGRYVVEEVTGRHDRVGRAFATALTAGVPLMFLLREPGRDAAGNVIPVWRAFWDLFGASNQLLAALTLIGVTVWLWRTQRAMWVWLVTGVPTVWMYVMSLWALGRILRVEMNKPRAMADPVMWICLLLVGLAVLMFIEAVRVLAGTRRSPPSAPFDAAAVAG